MKAIVAMLAVWTALLFSAEISSAHASSSSGQCTGLLQTDFVNSDVQQDTSSTWTNATEGFMPFTSASIGCVIITFYAPTIVRSETIHGNTLHARILLDGSLTCVPANYSDVFGQAGNYGPVFDYSSMTRVCEHVTGGAHTVQVQFRGDLSDYDDRVTLNSHVLTVRHN